MNSATQEVWRGRPWILPYVALRTIFVAVLTLGTLFLENSMGILYDIQAGLSVQVWTLIGFFIVWIIVVFGLLTLWYTNLYTLRKDSLEIKVGLLTTKTSVIVPTGFSDLEINRSIISRILGTGEIMIKTQSERDFAKRMVKVKDPVRIATLIREVMGRPIFKLDDGSYGKNS